MTPQQLRELAELIESDRQLTTDLSRVRLRRQELEAELRQWLLPEQAPALPPEVLQNLQQLDREDHEAELAELEADERAPWPAARQPIDQRVELDKEQQREANKGRRRSAVDEGSDWTEQPRHASAVLVLLQDKKQATAAELIEALVAKRRTTRDSVQTLLKQMCNRGEIRRIDRGVYALPERK